MAPAQRAAIEAFVAVQPEVERVLNMITLAWGDKMVIAVKARMQAQFPESLWVFFEPDER
ncbi:MAG: hypothetical protein M0Z99_30100 [Betaproteobacteria bacterium]|nr:hypothetical protein [Betaproteobacteria bacterium]